MIMSTDLQTEFKRTDGGRSQTERLRDYLVARPCQWVPMPELARAISQSGGGVGIATHSRINDCRRRFGMHIEVQVGLNRATGQRLASYFYDPELPGNFGCRRNKAGANVCGNTEVSESARNLPTP